MLDADLVRLVPTGMHPGCDCGAAQLACLVCRPSATAWGALRHLFCLQARTEKTRLGLAETVSVLWEYPVEDYWPSCP